MSKNNSSDKRFRGRSKSYSGEADDMIYKEMWTRMQYELIELDKKYSITETVQNYVDNEKYGQIMKKRYCFSMSVDDILKLMCEIKTDVKLEKYGKILLKVNKN